MKHTGKITLGISLAIAFSLQAQLANKTNHLRANKLISQMNDAIREEISYPSHNVQFDSVQESPFGVSVRVNFIPKEDGLPTCYTYGRIRHIFNQNFEMHYSPIRCDSPIIN